MANISQQYVDTDIRFMRRALRLAKKGQGMVSPNPLVGAIIVKNNRIIGEGYHEKYGQAHAEINAIKSSNKSVKNATLYCTLEPCCHTDKQTPPCTDRIIKERIKRVVIASIDPNPKVSGKGIKKLQDAGIEVTSGFLANENEEVNKFYFAFIKNKRPYVSLKIAQSIDGYITNKKNRQFWLTGERAIWQVHQWRSQYDAVLIGANTLRVDDPQLSVRYGKQRNPLRIVLSHSVKIDPSSKIFTLKPHDNTWLLTTAENQARLSNNLIKTGCRVFGLKADSNTQLTIRSVLKYLYTQKITSVLVEGGQQIFSQFITSGLWNELNVIVAPKILGTGIKGLDIETQNKISPLQLHKTKILGEDILITYLKK